VYDAALVDLDGVLYLGPDPVPHATQAVEDARAAGMRMAFVTNNSARRPAAVAAHLTELGIAASEADVVTSGQAATRWLCARLAPGSRVLVLGTDGLAEELEAAGLTPVREAEGAVAVVQGLAPTTSWADLAEACVALRGGALWVAGNTDATYPSARGSLPGNGSMVAALVTATGCHPVVVGKPGPELFTASIERVGARRALVVGDRLDSDILGAVRAGVDSLLVLTGVTDRAQLLAAPEQHRPTYLSTDLRGLVQPHQAPVVTGEVAICGTAKAWLDDGVLHTRPDIEDSDDALRAACALLWSRPTDAC